MPERRSSGGRGLLWVRSPELSDIVWQPIGHAINVVAMTSRDVRDVGPKLFCATQDNKLWWRDPIGHEVEWQHIGHANGVVAMTALQIAGVGSKLFCATEDNKLWWRDPVGSEVEWQHIGHANRLVGLAAVEVPGAGPKLFCATEDGTLNWRDPVGHEVNWQRIGHAYHVVAMTAVHGKLFCTTPGEVESDDAVLIHQEGSPSTLSDEERVAPLRALLPQSPELRALLAQKPDGFSWELHNELRHLLGGVDERLSMAQCNIILRHVPKDDYILSILSDWNLGKDSAAATRALLSKIEKYPDLEHMAAACALKVVELQWENLFR